MPILGRLLNLLFGFAIVTRIAWAPGWPHSHEYASFFTRTEIFAAHFRRLDFFPIWSTSDFSGFGSPLPFYYHRVFYYVSGAIRMLGFNVKIAVALALLIFFVLGYELVYRLIELLNPSPVVCVSLAFMYVYATYMMTNLVVRGAMAEITFTMIAPGLVYCWIRILRDQTWPWYTVLFALLCYGSHNAMTIALFFVLGIASLPSLLANGAATLRKVFRPFILSAVAGAALMAPYLYLYSVYGKSFNPAAVITEGGWTPTDNFPGLVEFLLMPTWFRMPDLVNLSLLAFIPLSAVGLYQRFKLGRKPVSAFGVSLILLALLPAMLQTSASEFLYKIFTFLSLVQFSWRFSGVLILALVVGLAALLSPQTVDWRASTKEPEQSADDAVTTPTETKFRPGFDVLLALVAGLTITVVAAPLLVRTDPSYEPIVIGDIARTPIVFELRYRGEYLPAVYGVDDTFEVRNAAADADIKFDYEDQGDCTLVIDPWKFEASSRTFTATCADATEIVLPLYYSELHKIRVDGRDSTARRTDLDGRIRVEVPAGSSQLEVAFPRVP